MVFFCCFDQGKVIFVKRLIVTGLVLSALGTVGMMLTGCGLKNDLDMPEDQTFASASMSGNPGPNGTRTDVLGRSDAVLVLAEASSQD